MYKIIGVAVLSVALFAPAMATAQDAAAQRLTRIRDNCQALHEVIDLQRRRDLVARTNRGREYENLNKQIDAFGQRLRNNRIDSQRFDRLFDEFQQASTEFRGVYTRYDNSLQAMLQTDCQKDSQKFSQFLSDARVLRAQTSTAVVQADMVLAQYRQAMVDMQARLQQAAQVVEGTND